MFSPFYIFENGAPTVSISEQTQQIYLGRVENDVSNVAVGRRGPGQSRVRPLEVPPARHGEALALHVHVVEEGDVEGDVYRHTVLGPRLAVVADEQKQLKHNY